MIPAVPQNLIATAGDGQITLAWTPVANATTYRLYWLTNAMVSKTRGSITVAATTPFTHLGPTNGTTYSYVVTALNSAGESAASNVASATPLVIDLTPPRVVTSRPSASETAVQHTRPVILRFSEPLDGATVIAANFTVTGPTGPVMGALTSAGDLLTFVPAAPLTAEATYTVAATTGIRDLAGNALGTAFSFTFTTCSAAPTNLTALQGAGDATLRWSAAPTATSYLLSRGTVSGGPYADVAGTATTFSTERALTAGTTYYFVVSAITPFGRSMPSAQLALTPSASGVAAPTAVTVVPAKTTALLSWSSVAGALSYNVYRSSSAAGPFVPVANVANVAFLDTGLSPATVYRYVVQTVAAASVSPYSEDVTCRLSATRLDAPTGLAGTPGNTWLQLNWSPVAGATSYVVYRQNAVNQPFGNAIPATTSHLLLQLSNGTTYNFLVGAVAAGEVGDFAPVSVIPGPTLPPRSALATAAVPRVNAVFVYFELGAGYTAHSLLRSNLPGGPYAVVSTNGNDNTGVVGTTYHYVVRAQNGGVNAAVSNEVSAASLAATALVAPTGVTATPGNGQVMVSWSPVPGAVSYNVYSGTMSGGPYPGPTCTATDETRCVLVGTNGTPSYVVVRAQGPTLAGPDSAQVSATPLTTLPAPPGVTVNPGNGAIRLTWPPVTGATSYRVHRRTPLSSWALLASPPGPSYVDTVANGAAYHYAVETVAVAGSSVWANLGTGPVWATTNEPAVPTGVGGAPGTGALMVSWAPVPGAASYSVISSLAPGGPYNQGTCVTSDTRCTFGATNGTTYYFVVSATGSNGAAGAPSAEQSNAPSAAFPPPPGATFTGGNGAVGHAWNAVPGATGYRVYRRGPNSDWKLLGPSTGLSFIDPVDNGVPWLYAFHTVSSGGDGVWVMPSSGARLASTLVPVAPAAVVATPGNVSSTISWAPVPDAVSFSVNASLAPGGPYTAGSCTAQGDTHCNLTPINGTPYYVVVAAIGSGGTSTPSAEVPFTAQSSAPLIPVIATNAAIAGNNANLISWPRVTAATSYLVHRRTGAGAWAQVGSPAVAIHYDEDVLNGESYQYAVQPVGGTPSAWSVSTAALVASSALPLPPKISLQAGNGLVTVRWVPVPGAAGYTARSSLVQGGPYASTCAPVGAFETVCNATIANGAPGYLVAQTSSGTTFSIYSPESTATPSAALSLANNVNPSIVAMRVHLAWVAASNGATSYRIYRRAPTTAPALIGEVSGLAFDDEGLATGTVYRYWVQPVNAIGAGAWSSAAQITAP